MSPLPRLSPSHAMTTAFPPLGSPLHDSLGKTGSQRLRTWEIPSTFHCSIIGTCLTAGELRQLLVKAGLEDARTASDHALHGRGVRLAGQRDQAAKMLNKALDKRHETSIKRLPRQADEAELLAIWRESFDRGDIAGPYWALMSHPASSPALIRDIFGEVHMLSHLVGSASRLDIARLTQLEKDLEQARQKAARQELRLKATAAERVEQQQHIRQIEERLIRSEALAASATRQAQAKRHAVERSDADGTRATGLSQRLVEMEERYSALQHAFDQLQDLNHAVLRENDALETAIASHLRKDAEGVSLPAGGPVLYVGGRRNLFDHIRAYAESRNIDLLLHDGGMEDSTTLLPALIGQAATVLFPVDHISHTAVGILKRLCREQGKSYLPLRSAGLASFLAAITGAGGVYGRP
ncbi:MULTISPECIES: DUF2325 domain-containing protein [unclassified Rhizobium]|uniref:DUF2325 domain-containing protein n=1 Tax=unclassified Rhizobium TaxID=2613769 RepID=UPI0006F4F5F9|nr:MULTISPECIES: DUF2325 domain-containing protein [unclassified Rhizobium]KQV33687.1 hypothetical protein ASC86_16985 [Rhizobium sp. Root1212]KRD23231.1 hypothetical protein ASE37_16905 [Rhizobium sp. Root268]